MAGQYRAGQGRNLRDREPKSERIGARKIFALRLDGVSNGQPSNIPGNSTLCTRYLHYLRYLRYLTIDGNITIDTDIDRRRLAETRVLPQAASSASQAEIAEIIGCSNPGPFLLFSLILSVLFCFFFFLAQRLCDMAINEAESV